MTANFCFLSRALLYIFLIFSLNARRLFNPVNSSRSLPCFTPDLIDRLDDIKDDLALTGIEFDYKIRDFHDRTIKTDTGWTIMMGRGLDIYEKYSPYSVAANKQELRKCKEFMVTYLKNKS